MEPLDPTKRDPRNGEIPDAFRFTSYTIHKLTDNPADIRDPIPLEESVLLVFWNKSRPRRILGSAEQFLSLARDLQRCLEVAREERDRGQV